MYKRTECPICGLKPCEQQFQLPFLGEVLGDFTRRCTLAQALAGEQYVLLHCRRCGLYFQELVPTLEEAQLLYGDAPEPQRSHRPRPVAELAHLAEEAMLIRLLFPDRRPVVLDFGMGMGGWAGMACAYDCESWGTDLAAYSPAAAKEKGVIFVPAGDLPASRFDFINADQVFEHVAEPRHALDAVVRSLKPGGILKISTPGDRHLERKIARAKAGSVTGAGFFREFDSLSPLHHLNLFNKPSLRALGRRAGLVPFGVPLALSYSVMTLFDTTRQWNRNLWHPFKRWRSAGTWQYFVKL